MRKVNDSEQKVTLIDNLPDLEDIDTMSILTSEQRNKVNSKIRQSFPTSEYSGMNVNNKNDYGSRMHARQDVLVNTRQENNNLNTSNIEQSSQNTIYNQPQAQAQAHFQDQAVQEGFKHFNMPIGSPSCLDVAEHISKCPICSKFYNTDKTIYIIAIITLAIICILLLKKVLDV